MYLLLTKDASNQLTTTEQRKQLNQECFGAVRVLWTSNFGGPKLLCSCYNYCNIR
jgi:hypothetical protein